MVAPAVARGAWVGAAVLAGAVLVAIAAHGRRPDSSLVRFEAAGIMAAIPPEGVSEVAVSRDGRVWRFTRAGGTAWVAAAETPGPAADAGPSIEAGLRFLHASAPQRVLAADELSATPLAELGLDPPRYRVSVGPASAPVLAVEFGALNAQGLGQYARVSGHTEVLLLPAFAGEPWAAIGALPSRPR